LASPILAQTRVRTPDKGVIGYGADAGVLFPDEEFENTFTSTGSASTTSPARERPRAVRVCEPRAVGHQRRSLPAGEAPLLRRLQLGKRILAPVRAIRRRLLLRRLRLDATTDPPGETRGGLNFGGGTEYLLSNEAAIKVELRWDVVSHPFDLPDATGTTLTFGYKRYF
jgi:hypothetical protein